MNKQLHGLIERFSGLRVLVVGEAMLDSYIKGTSDRLSPEAPVPVVAVNERVNLPGGAANTAVNINSLGAEVEFLSVIGADNDGALLVGRLREYGISPEHLILHPDRKTLLKCRVMSDSQILLRFDQGSIGPIDSRCEKRLLQKLAHLLPRVDAVILSDYRYGILTQRVLRALSEINQHQPKPLLVDSKDLRKYLDLKLTAIKPNYHEAAELLGLEKVEDSSERVRQMTGEGLRLLDIFNTRIAAVTIDHDGAIFFERGRPPYRTYARPSGATRVSGAGDTFISALALAIAAQADTQIAAEIASAAASVVVVKDGTSVCSAEELKANITGVEKRVDDPFTAIAQIAVHRSQGRKIVFTNGCFDILHSGHVTYLNQAKEQGDVLVIGLNSDNSVRRLKGPNRPINDLDERARVLSALSCVDHVIPFYEDTPVELIKQIKPDVYVKGGDYTRETLPEAPVVEALGGEVRILPYLDGQSTSNVIDRIRKIYVERGETQR